MISTFSFLLHCIIENVRKGIRGGGKRRVAREDTELGIHCLLRVITVVSILGKTWSNKDFFYSLENYFS